MPAVNEKLKQNVYLYFYVVDIIIRGFATTKSILYQIQFKKSFYQENAALKRVIKLTALYNL
jgi:hypothetical protein